jgi:hypothetical protein
VAVETRVYRFTNNVTLELANAIDDVQELIDVVDDDALPALDVDEICTIVLRDDADSKYEIMNVTSHGGNVLAVERGAEDTTRFEWPAGTVIQHALTAMFFMKLAEPPAAFFRTSKPYPHVIVEALDLNTAISSESPSEAMQVEALDMASIIVEGILNQVLLAYEEYQPEALDHDSIIISGTLNSVLEAYENYQPEALDISAIPLEGELREALIRYQNYQDEALDVGCTLVSGALT